MPNLISGAIGQGVGLVSEYRKHRQEQKRSREASIEVPQGPSQAHAHSDPLPSYEDTTGQQESVSDPFPPDAKDPVQYEIDTDSDYDSSLGDDSDDEAWASDEAVTHSDSDEPPSYETITADASRETTNELVQEIAVSSRLQPTTSSGTPFVRQPLPCPVILPQRRPHKKARGFVRAYAPALAETGIDQETFLTFLKNFHKSSQASPIFDVIGISAGIAGFAPSIIAMVVCAAVEVGAKVGSEMRARYRTNNFLDRVNETLFRPAGLFAMIVRYKASEATDAQPISAETVNLSTYRAMAKVTKQRSCNAEGKSSRSMSDQMSNLRVASDTTRGALQMPEAAPLIYPDLDHKLAQEGPESFKDKSKDAKKFVADYIDRRAQMSFAKQAPPSSLVIPQGDYQPPTGAANAEHAMYSGGLVALISGGTITPRLRKEERRANKQSAKDMRRIARGREPRHGYVTESADVQGYDGAGFRAVAGPSGGTYVHSGKNVTRRERKLRKTAKRVFKEDVLYLMIVNMPSDAELDAAREELARGKG
ncbi:uncharacterized protein MYCGRDRAFT_109426 [Zymoseptoria tritici IPO323]|uniref:Uncharacterized protein n=1 Tax=Zymoseptoria tritici (strain CBS 115943 / IPO323) TaxID=336722 RepID=F9XBM1_ZYMTI|nr:uncharacterized protein MYCGRDRAFT_109426 [Zymoseptoria tritici IPO323]EGP87665.1 hypothetical protein MYCGRDRAFT_109426 [Zymoseptoria tritici IPO323]